jgi:hypothetical protein
VELHCGSFQRGGGFEGFFVEMKNRTYSEKLKDTRWQERRLHLFNKAVWTCELCNANRPACGLQVHHPVYLTGLEPWEYPDELVMVLCDPCHVERQSIERDFFAKVAVAIKWKSNDELREMPVWWMIETRITKESEQ